VTIEFGPSSWQILQQDENGFAAFGLSGRWREHPQNPPKEAAFQVEVRLVHESSCCPVSAALDWAKAEMAPDRTWRMTLRDVPAGGLYRVETRVSRRNLPDERPLRGDYIHHLGVGDLWCIAGQSNASGTGAGIAEDGPELGVHLFGNDERWRLATHPLEDATGTKHPITITGIYHGHSPWLAFAKLLKRHLAIPIGLIPTALGGSPLSRWNPQEPGTADLYDNMMQMIERAGGDVRGIVWYQGESDGSPALAKTYGARFRQFVESVRCYLESPQLPILTGQLNRSTMPHLRIIPPQGGAQTWFSEEAHRSWSLVREAQRQAAKEIPNVYIVPTTDLSLSDNIHNSAPAEVVLGERFANLALGKVYGHPALDSFPELTRAAFATNDKTELSLVFENVGGGWCALGPVEDFRVEDESGWITIKEIALGEGAELRIRLARAPQGAVTLHGAYGINPTTNLRDSNRRPFVAFSVRVPQP
jgi:hypothetical protein